MPASQLAELSLLRLRQPGAFSLLGKVCLGYTFAFVRGLRIPQERGSRVQVVGVRSVNPQSAKKFQGLFANLGVKTNFGQLDWRKGRSALLNKETYCE